MNLLAVDTSGPVAGVAVLKDGEVAYEGAAVNRLTRHLNVSAARLLDEYHVKYESRTRHEGRRIRLTYTLVDARGTDLTA